MLAAERQKHILIVDRDIAMVEPLREQLRRTGFMVLAITDGAAAADAIAQRPPQLIVVDWNMPGLAALELIEQVRMARRLHPIRFIILSELTAEQDVVAGLNILLEFLMSHPGRTFNRAQLLAQVWAVDNDIDERTVDVNVQRLRKILAKPGFGACIQTARGFGYRFIER